MTQKAKDMVCGIDPDYPVGHTPEVYTKSFHGFLFGLLIDENGQAHSLHGSSHTMSRCYELRSGSSTFRVSGYL